MIINQLAAVCPSCDEHIRLDVDDREFRIEVRCENILLTFRCPKCEEFIEGEALEKE